MQLREGVERCVRDATARNRGRVCGLADDDDMVLCGCVSLGDFMSRRDERCRPAFTTYEC